MMQIIPWGIQLIFRVFLLVSSPLSLCIQRFGFDSMLLWLLIHNAVKRNRFLIFVTLRVGNCFYLQVAMFC